MASKLRGKGKGVVFWLLLALIILGLGGFGITNFGGSSQTVASVGGKDITVREYGRALQVETNALSAQMGRQVPFAQAQQMGLDRAVLARLVGQAALDESAAALGISAGDDQVRGQIVNASAFRGIDGKFDREIYSQALARQGINEGEFEADLRADASRTLLQGAVAGGTAAPASYVATVGDWATERRGFTYVALTADQLEAPVPAPTDADLQSYLDAHPEQFTLPETRVVSYAWLSPEMMRGKVEMDEAALKQAYENRKDEFVQPEKRMVERLVFGSEDEAKAAKARLDAGQITFPALVAERGLSLEDIDQGEVTLEQLGDAGAAVFALAEPGVAGPLPSPLGPALYSMNGIIAAQDVPYEEAREQLSEEVAVDRARRMIEDQTQDLDDQLAGGATLEELAKQNGMEFGKAEVAEAATGQGVAGYQDFREAALAAQEGDFPELHTLEDGGVFALQLDEIRPPRTQTLDEARDALVAAWTADRTEQELLAEAQGMAELPDLAAAATQRGLQAQSVSPTTRGGYVEALPADGLNRIFALAKRGDTVAMPGPKPGTALAVRLDSIAVPPEGDADAQPLRDALSQQLRQSIAQDMLQMYVNAAQDAEGVTVNQNTVNAVNAQMQ